MWIVSFITTTALLVAVSEGLITAEQDTTLEGLALKLQQLEWKVAILESNQKGDGVGPVAFTSALSQTLTSVGAHQHIVFDNVITNVGNGYHALDGHFIAPVRGVYVFYVSLTNIPQHSASAQLLKNGIWIGNVLAHGSTTNTGLYVTSTLVVTVQLQHGDEVWVQNEYAFSGVEEIDGGNWSYFSGHLIKSN